MFCFSFQKYVVCIICSHAQIMLFILNPTGQVTSHGGIYHSEPQPLRSVQINLKTSLSLLLSVSIRKLWSGVHTKGKSLPSWQRWNDIHGWMDPYKISPSINNHDWFQGHKLLQPRVWKSGAAYAKWPGIYQQFLKIPFLYFKINDKTSKH